MTIDINSDFEFVTNIANSGRNGFVELFLIKYNSNNDPLIYKPILEPQAQNEFINIYLNYFTKPETRNQTQEPFNLIKGDNDTLALLSLDTFERPNTLINRIRNNIECLTDLSNLQLDTVKAYAVRFHYDQTSREVIYFSSIQGYKKFKKGFGFIGNITNNKVEKINPKDLLGFNPVLGGYVNEHNEIVITTKSIFENAFKMREVYKAVARPVLEFVRSFNKIENFENFEQDTLANSNLSRRVAMLENKKIRVEKLLNNISKVQEALNVEEYRQRFEGIIVTDDKIVYNSEYKDKFVTLISDTAVVSFVTAEKFLSDT